MKYTICWNNYKVVDLSLYTDPSAIGKTFKQQVNVKASNDYRVTIGLDKMVGVAKVTVSVCNTDSGSKEPYKTMAFRVLFDVKLEFGEGEIDGMESRKVAEKILEFLPDKINPNINDKLLRLVKDISAAFGETLECPDSCYDAVLQV